VIATDKFVFVHLPRTGGTFISELLKKYFPSAQEIGYHFPRALIPEKYSHLPILGGIRNPWEFYASWYHHQQSDTRDSPLFCGLSDNRTLDFSGTVTNALNLGVDKVILDRLIQRLPEHFNYEQKHVSNVTKSLMQKIGGTGLGLLTFRFDILFGDANDVYFCRLESLRSDLLMFLENVGAASVEIRDCVLNLEKKNVSEHRHYSSYYTPKLAELVSIRDKPIIERFRYKFEHAPLS
jgi:hypothetical protein